MAVKDLPNPELQIVIREGQPYNQQDLEQIFTVAQNRADLRGTDILTELTRKGQFTAAGLAPNATNRDQKALATAQAALDAVLAGTADVPYPNATHYANLSTSSPSWAKSFDKQGELNGHTYFIANDNSDLDPGTSKRPTSDPGVLYLQQQLNKTMEAGLKEDGVMGPATEAALLAYYDAAYGQPATQLASATISNPVQQASVASTPGAIASAGINPLQYAPGINPISNPNMEADFVGALVGGLMLANNPDVTITSTYRTPTYNASLPDAAPNSLHTQGQAVDIRISNLTPEQEQDLMASLQDMGLSASYHGTDHIHVSSAGGVPDPAAVAALQTQLAAAGLYSGEIDGVMGPGTLSGLVDLYDQSAAGRAEVEASVPVPGMRPGSPIDLASLSDAGAATNVPPATGGAAGPWTAPPPNPAMTGPLPQVHMPQGGSIPTPMRTSVPGPNPVSFAQDLLRTPRLADALIENSNNSAAVIGSTAPALSQIRTGPAATRGGYLNPTAPTGQGYTTPNMPAGVPARYSVPGVGDGLMESSLPQGVGMFDALMGQMNRAGTVKTAADSLGYTPAQITTGPSAVRTSETQPTYVNPTGPPGVPSSPASENTSVPSLPAYGTGGGDLNDQPTVKTQPGIQQGTAGGSWVDTFETVMVPQTIEVPNPAYDPATFNVINTGPMAGPGGNIYGTTPPEQVAKVLKKTVMVPQTVKKRVWQPGIAKGAAQLGARAVAKAAFSPSNEQLLKSFTGGAPISQAAFGPQSPGGSLAVPASGGPNFDYSRYPSPVSGTRTAWVDQNGVVHYVDAGTNLHSSGAVPPTSTSATSGSTKVMCTHFMRRGWLPRAIWVGEARFALSELSEETRAGYRMWATPLVRRMEAGNRLLEALWWPVVWSWANEAANAAGEPSARSTLAGKAVRAVLEPFSRLVYRLSRRHAHAV